MAYLDQQTHFSDAQVVTATGNSTNTVDLTANVRVGLAQLYVLANLTGITGTPTLTIALQGSTDSAFTTPVQLSAVTPTLAAGVNQNVILDAAVVKALRYYRLVYTVGGGTPNVVITASFAMDVPADYQNP